ncbi:MAG TPA: hypothetical protein VMU42_19100 [Candidatus Sulfotelmatobacter sp.]|nr:hypothetical protein [Candidatus Sulfotelmatobacter sp.]
MAENPSEPSPDNDQARVDGAGQSGSETVASNLPMVVAPKLGAGEEDVIDETIGATEDEPAAPAAPPQHSTRFLMLAASVAFAAAFGSFAGSLSGTGLVHIMSSAPQPAAGAALSSEAMRQMKLELTELASIRSNLDTTSRSTTTQLAKLSERLDKFDQRAAAAEVTGSITKASAAPLPVSAPKIPDRILQDWIVQDVQSGRALVQNRYGGMFDVGEGSTLPGVGRIDGIKRQDGQWIVLTERGTITSGR